MHEMVDEILITNCNYCVVEEDKVFLVFKQKTDQR